jgi:PAS domain S-box-containing protein
MHEMYGIANGEQVTYQDWVNLMLPEDLPVAEAALQAVVESGSQAFMEFRIRHPNGTVRHIQSAEGAVQDGSGQVVRVVGINLDVTERKRSEAVLAETRQSLELRLGELARANQELAAKNQEVEAFAYIVSHDLRAPLVNMQGFCKELETCFEELRGHLSTLTAPSVAEKRVQAILSEDIPDSLRFINSSTIKFGRLIDALLELSRCGRQVYTSEEVDLRSVVQSTLDLFRLSIAAAGVQISLKPIPKVSGDPTALGQVFANLIGNAIKYLQPSRPGVIEIGGEAHNGEAHCWVRDNGAGLPPVAKERLFQVFQRFHPNLAQGDGMGLALVKRILERHGGNIWAESEDGAGTTFHFTLPMAPTCDR